MSAASLIFYLTIDRSYFRKTNFWRFFYSDTSHLNHSEQRCWNVFNKKSLFCEGWNPTFLSLSHEKMSEQGVSHVTVESILKTANIHLDTKHISDHVLRSTHHLHSISHIFWIVSEVFSATSSAVDHGSERYLSLMFVSTNTVSSSYTSSTYLWIIITTGVKMFWTLV